jgi:hypothetical protein
MRITHAKRALALAFLLTILSSPARANMIWPAGIEALTMLFWSIPVGLFIEWIVVKTAFIPDGRTAFRAVAWANAASTLAGFLLLPFVTVMVDGIATAATHELYGRSHDAACLVVYAPFAAVFSSFVEWGVLARWFAVPGTGRAFGIILAANVATTAVAILPAMITLFG